MAKSQDADELLALLAELTAGTLTDSQTSRLAELLRDNSDAQRRYVEHLSMHARLHLEYSQGANVGYMPGLSFMPEGVSGSFASPPAVRPAKRARIPVSLASVLLAAAVLALVVNVTFFLRQPSQKAATDGHQSVTERASSSAFAESGVAVLTTAVGVQWSQPGDGGKTPADVSLTGDSPAVGAALRPRRLQLHSGLVQLEFYSGATVVLEGPADFEIVSSMKAICRSGRLRAHVPRQAQGFQIETPNATLVDLGTEFGVHVDPTGQAEVHVFAGKVQVHPEPSNRVMKQQQDVSAGNGLRIGASDAVREIPLSEGEFVTVAELQQRAARSAEAHFDRWQAHSKSLHLDSRVLLYYTFDDQTSWDRMLVNRAGTEAPRVLDGAIVGCQWSAGRWPEKGALDFKRPSDRVRIEGPIQCDSMTFAAWIRLDALQKAISALLLTDRYEEGNPHWQITEQGQLSLGVSHGDADIRSRNKYRSPPVFGPDQLGTWTHVATVYDRTEGVVMHYVNGQAVSRQEMFARLPLRIEAAEIGNWVVPRETGAEPIRNFNGRIDEFLLFREALEPHEIRQMFEAGKMDDLPRDYADRRRSRTCRQRTGGLLREPASGVVQGQHEWIPRGPDPRRAGSIQAKDGRRLLVRVLQSYASRTPNNAINQPGWIETYQKDVRGQRDFGIGKRLVICSRSVAPDFKVLLFPHCVGDPLPVTTWNKDRTRLTVEWSDQKDAIAFIRPVDGRTRLKIQRDGSVTADLD